VRRHPTTFEEFWPYYLEQHAQPGTRALHLVGTAAAIALLALAVAFGVPMLAIAGVVTGYACAWIGHAIFEGNRPATFTNPLWSFVADLRMLAMWMTGRLSGELRRLGIDGGKPGG
jgi:hypothetical protein